MKIIHLKNNKGGAYILVMVLVLVVSMFTSVLITFFSARNQVKQIKKAVESAVISVCLDNYGNMYSSEPEGYTGAYKLSDGYWKLDISSGDVYSKLMGTLTLTKQNDKYVKLSGEKTIYSLSDLSVSATAAGFKSDTYTQTLFNADSSIYVSLNASFLGIDFTINKTVQCKSRYNYKF